MPFFGVFAWEDAVVARWSANPLSMLWPEMDVVLIASGGGGGPAVTPRRPVVVAGS